MLARKFAVFNFCLFRAILNTPRSTQLSSVGRNQHLSQRPLGSQSSPKPRKSSICDGMLAFREPSRGMVRIDETVSQAVRGCQRSRNFISSGSDTSDSDIDIQKRPSSQINVAKQPPKAKISCPLKRKQTTLTFNQRGRGVPANYRESPKSNFKRGKLCGKGLPANYREPQRDIFTREQFRGIGLRANYREQQKENYSREHVRNTSVKANDCAKQKENFIQDNVRRAIPANHYHQHKQNFAYEGIRGQGVRANYSQPQNVQC